VSAVSQGPRSASPVAESGVSEAMFLQNNDLDEEDLEDEANFAPVVDLGMLPKNQQALMGSNPQGDETPRTTQSSQYNERLARARATKMATKRPMNNGMIMANMDSLSRPGTASNAASIDVLSAEVEEMELEEGSTNNAYYAQQPPQQSSTSQYLRQQAPPQTRDSSPYGSTSGRMSPSEESGQYEAVRQAPMTTTMPRAPPPPAVIDTTDLRAFLMRPGPQGAMVQCYIQRKKTGMARLFPTYEIYLKEGDKFLLAARKRKKNKSSNYLLSLDKDDLQRQSGNFFGKLRSNFIGTEFTLYDKGSNPEKDDSKGKTESLVQTRQELACILYKQNVLGSRGPRKMKVMVPNVNEAGERKELRPQNSEETMLERYKAAMNDADVQILKNKPPKWNEQVGAYVLNFNGRVTRASVKNFQLYNPSRDPDAVIMQFGRVGKDAFTMDFQAPLCALQAFGIALSSFDYKIACE